MSPRRSSLKAKDKLALLLVVVPYLIDRGSATVDEVAERFGIAPAQVRELVSLISVSGIPGETAQYLHGDLFDIDFDAFHEHDEIVLTHHVVLSETPRFSAREAAALITGLHYVAMFAESSGAVDADSPEHGELLHGVIAKLRRGSQDQPLAVALNETVNERALSAIAEAVQRGRQLEFDYRGLSGSAMRRTVDPLRVHSTDSSWYLTAWCHLRDDVRVFHLSRMSAVEVTSRPVEKIEAAVELPDDLFATASAGDALTLRVAPGAAPLVRELHPESVVEGDTGVADAPSASSTATGETGSLAVVRASHYHGIKRFAARHPGLIEVVEPAPARQAVHDWALRALQAYADNPSKAG